ncbi:hypothetical protein [Bradyrhizobium sp. 62]|uniref:hypothetical protein n=1 Tax=Bradyrhizobium sp. 62 TaxID=1043588 RepID=UPI001FF85C0B|nr:hypothetical protein [Bradyrhizobium sp. 62]MCK1368294.1 hypothetical protein [Bradyrhizobium sp. 62]
MIEIKKISKDLNAKCRSLAALRKDCEVLLKGGEADAGLATALHDTASALEQRCRVSMAQNIALLEILAEHLDFRTTPLVAMAKFIKSEARLSAEHKLINSIVERVRALKTQSVNPPAH